MWTHLLQEYSHVYLYSAKVATAHRVSTVAVVCVHVSFWNTEKLPKYGKNFTVLYIFVQSRTHKTMGLSIFRQKLIAIGRISLLVMVKWARGQGKDHGCLRIINGIIQTSQMCCRMLGTQYLRSTVLSAH